MQAVQAFPDCRAKYDGDLYRAAFAEFLRASGELNTTSRSFGSLALTTISERIGDCHDHGLRLAEAARRYDDALAELKTAATALNRVIIQQLISPPGVPEDASPASEPTMTLLSKAHR